MPGGGPRAAERHAAREQLGPGHHLQLPLRHPLPVPALPVPVMTQAVGVRCRLNVDIEAMQALGGCAGRRDGLVQFLEPLPRGLVRLSLQQDDHVYVAAGRAVVTGRERAVDIDADEIAAGGEAVREPAEH
jgi:hypothetical protein